MKRFRDPLLWFSLAAGSLLLMVCSRNSPLYAMNEWVDVNCFFTVGRGMLDGLMPYRDLYEQKGPILYLIHMLAALISRDSFIGVYLMETLAFSLYLYFCGKCTQVFRADFLTGALAALFCGLVAAAGKAFSPGGSAEAYCLWTMVFALYAAMKALHSGRPMPVWRAMTVGAGAGMTLMVKFTFLGFFIGLCAFAVLWYGLRREWKTLMKTAGGFLAGFTLVAAAVCVWFYLRGALGDLIRVYFIDNLTVYPRNTDNRLMLIWKCVRKTVGENRWMWAAIAAAAGAFLLRGRRYFLMMPVMLAATLTGTYWGGYSWPYYGLIAAPYLAFAGAAAADITGRIPRRRSLSGRGGKRAWLIAMAALIAAAGCAFHTCESVSRMPAEREELPQYIFAEHIPEDATLLNYDFLDAGFYYASGATPSCRFFCTLNLPLEEMKEEMDRQLREGVPDFVVTRNKTLEEYGVIGTYERVDTASADYGEGMFNYFLYRRIE